MSAPVFCDRCGRSRADGDHAACSTARGLEPPRFCAGCGRRMKVQITPLTWTAVCVQHGSIDGRGT
ncbi:biotin synthase auxiliary protein BsaP [Geodermatophilus chilensis]